MQKRKSGRGRDDSRAYPFADLFDLRTYAGAVYCLLAHGGGIQSREESDAGPAHGGVAELAGHDPPI